jgi:hypothetical protein
MDAQEVALSRTRRPETRNGQGKYDLIEDLFVIDCCSVRQVDADHPIMLIPRARLPPVTSLDSTHGGATQRQRMLPRLRIQGDDRG